MSPDDALYAFFVRAEERDIAMMLDTSSDEKWKNNIRKAANMPNAEVHLIREGEWEAPKLRSVDEGSAPCIKGIQKYFATHNLPLMSRDDFAREYLGDMKSAMTGLLVVLVRHSTSPSPHADTPQEKKWWQVWK